MQQGIPGSPPPSSHAPGNNNLGPTIGSQAKEQWTVGQSDERGLLSAMRSPQLWRVTLHGTNATFRVSWGTSGNIVVAGISSPARFVVPGSVDVYAKPVDLTAPAAAWVSCTLATSGGEAIMRVNLAGNALPIDPNAARFVALSASVVGVGPAATRINVNLTPLQSVLLVAGSVLTSGGGYLEYEP